MRVQWFGEGKITKEQYKRWPPERRRKVLGVDIGVDVGVEVVVVKVEVVEVGGVMQQQQQLLWFRHSHR